MQTSLDIFAAAEDSDQLCTCDPVQLSGSEFGGECCAQTHSSKKVQVQFLQFFAIFNY